ncbi:FkbM family methyltransferase [Mycolicibacterium gilvum]|uniref:FkbM family methyltransferase n=1 Tax=Mycolicibacterium gilvum TaxID=1804 RepID=A0A378SJF4_9MYCO|nr:FkbM family methyltransferase [Mycolicibacterium gilvum]MCV7055742.1 FkbM family methyltransferase [Mycolicibacterium gilvum]STZ42268.1 FkbM family methyltransferase [Mycolicibacterium gilvum]
MEHHGISHVIDVGANDGGFASEIRQLGYDGTIVSFEPLQEPYEKLRRKSTLDGKWQVHRRAIGDFDGEVTINVSGNSGLSSSVLPMLDAHVEVAPNSGYVAQETVPQARLDTLLPQLGVDTTCRTFLKVDVQGYEAAVLDGAVALFEEGGILGLQLELSLTQLYAGGMTYREGLDRAEALGFSLMGLDPVFSDPRTGRLLQVDAIFFAA